jgi:hypothetical protein
MMSVSPGSHNPRQPVEVCDKACAIECGVIREMAR